MITYLLQATLCMAFFYAFYHLTLRRETLFHTNRIFLLVTLAISLILPLIKIYIDAESTKTGLVNTTYTYVGTYLDIFTDQVVISSERESFPWIRVLSTIYFTGVLVMTIRFLIALREIFRIKVTGKSTLISGTRCIVSEKVKTPFSFFNTIYLPMVHSFSDHEIKEILSHEIAHIKQLHTWDIILMELVCIKLWPSPLVYLYRKSLKEVHEYVADAEVLKDTPWENYAKLLVAQQSHNLQHTLSNQLMYSQLKQRLRMMNQPHSSLTSRFKYLGIIPILFLAIIIFSFRETTLKIGEVVDTNAIGEANQIKMIFEMDEQLLDTLPPSYIPSLRLTEPEPEKSNEPISNFVQTANDQINLDYTLGLPIFPGCDEVTIGERGMCGMTKLGEYINQHLIYPESLRKTGLEGKVMVKFTVGTDGYVKTVAIAKSLHPDADQMVLDLFNGMNKNVGQWRPARNEGKSFDAELVLPINFTLDQPSPKSEPFTYAEEMPRFPGCENIYNVEERQNCSWSKLHEFVYANISYPKDDRDNNIEGTGIIQFTIGPDGSLYDFKVVRTPSPTIATELLRLMSVMAALPDKWVPAYNDGKPVALRFTLPVRFVLQDMTPVISEKPAIVADPVIKVVVTAIAPNPAAGFINVDVFEGAHTLKIFDSSSRQVLSLPIPTGRNNKQTVDISSLIPGSYIVQVMSDTQSSSGSFTVVKE